MERHTVVLHGGPYDEASTTTLAPVGSHFAIIDDGEYEVYKVTAPGRADYHDPNVKVVDATKFLR